MRALLTVLVLTTTACATTQGDKREADNHATRDLLLQTDKAMSAVSARSGMGAAFAKMFDVEAVSLRNGTQPLKGRDAIIASTMRCGAACEMTWEPLSADADGGIGYTWGTYTLTHTTTGEPVQTTTGTYITTWKRDDKGQWYATVTSNTRDD